MISGPEMDSYCDGCTVPDCDFYDGQCSRDRTDWLDQHDKMVREAERGRCAVKCDEIAAHWREQAERHNIPNDHGRRDGAKFCAIAIREEGENA